MEILTTFLAVAVLWTLGMFYSKEQIPPIRLYLIAGASVLVIAYWTLIPRPTVVVEPFLFEQHSEHENIWFYGFYNQYQHIVSVPNNVVQVHIRHPRVGSIAPIDYVYLYSVE
jgi:hypothetical protein